MFRLKTERRECEHVRPGAYLSSDRCLYRVEHLAGDRVLIEDCRSGDLLDIDLDECASLKRVEPSASATV